MSQNTSSVSCDYVTRRTEGTTTRKTIMRTSNDGGDDRNQEHLQKYGSNNVISHHIDEKATQQENEERQTLSSLPNILLNGRSSPKTTTGVVDFSRDVQQKNQQDQSNHSEFVEVISTSSTSPSCLTEFEQQTCVSSSCNSEKREKEPISSSLLSSTPAIFRPYEKSRQLGSNCRQMATNTARMKKHRCRLIDAVNAGNVEKLIKLLVKTDPNFIDEKTGETPLSLAASNNTLQTTSIQRVIVALINGGAILDYRNREGRTALHTAVMKNNYIALKMFLDLGAPPNYLDCNGLTPLFYSIIYNNQDNNHKVASQPFNNIKITKLLLYEHSIHGVTDQQGWQEVHHAAKLGLAGHLEMLLFYGVDINAQITGSGNTPLHVAAINDQKECVRTLLLRGCDTSIVNNSHQTAQQVAVIAGNVNLADLIQNHRQVEDVVLFKRNPSLKASKSSSHRMSANNCKSITSRCNQEEKVELEYDGSDRDASPCPSQRSTCSTSIIASSSSSSSSTTSSSGVCELDHSSQSESTTTETNGSDLLSTHLGGVNRMHGILPLLRIEGRREQKLFGGCRSGSVTGSLTTTLPTRGGRKRCFSPTLPSTPLITTTSTLSCIPSSNNSSVIVERNTALFSLKVSYRERTVSLDRGKDRGFGFILRGAKASSPLVQQSSPRSEKLSSLTPVSFQYLDEIEVGGVAQLAGLRKGDYVLTVNGIDVRHAPHEQVVSIIRQSGERVTLTVATPFYVLVNAADDEINHHHHQESKNMQSRSRLSCKDLPMSNKGEDDSVTDSPIQPSPSGRISSSLISSTSHQSSTPSPPTSTSGELPAENNENSSGNEEMIGQNTGLPCLHHQVVPATGADGETTSLSSSSSSSGWKGPPPAPPKRNSSLTTTMDEMTSHILRSVADTPTADSFSTDNDKLHTSSSSSNEQQSAVISGEAAGVSVVNSHHQLLLLSSSSLPLMSPSRGELRLNTPTIDSVRNKQDNNYDFEVKSDNGVGPTNKSIESLTDDTSTHSPSQHHLIQSNESVTPNSGQHDSSMLSINSKKIASIRSRGGIRRLSALGFEGFTQEDFNSLQVITSPPAQVTMSTWSKGQKSPFQLLKLKKNRFNQKLSKSFRSTSDIQDELSVAKDRFRQVTEDDLQASNEISKRFMSQDYLNESITEAVVETVTLKNGKIVKDGESSRLPNRPPPPVPNELPPRRLSSFYKESSVDIDICPRDESDYVNMEQIRKENCVTKDQREPSSASDTSLEETCTIPTSTTTNTTQKQGILKMPKKPSVHFIQPTSLFIPEPDYSTSEDEATPGTGNRKLQCDHAETNMRGNCQSDYEGSPKTGLPEKKKSTAIRDYRRRSSLTNGIVLPLGNSSHFVENLSDSRLENCKVQTLNRKSHQARMSIANYTQTLPSSMKHRKASGKILEKRVRIADPPEQPASSTSHVKEVKEDLSPNLGVGLKSPLEEVIPPPPQFASPLAERPHTPSATLPPGHKNTIVYQHYTKLSPCSPPTATAVNNNDSSVARDTSPPSSHAVNGGSGVSGQRQQQPIYRVKRGQQEISLILVNSVN